jgi:hypothetical protein
MSRSMRRSVGSEKYSGTTSGFPPKVRGRDVAIRRRLRTTCALKPESSRSSSAMHYEKLKPYNVAVSAMSSD